jgi:hypothetical protein
MAGQSYTYKALVIHDVTSPEILVVGSRVSLAAAGQLEVAEKRPSDDLVHDAVLVLRPVESTRDAVTLVQEE